MITTFDNWYALAVTSGHEQSIARRIRERLEKAGQFTIDMEIVSPDEEVVVDAGTKDRRVVKKNTLPGYLLLRARRLPATTASNIMRVNGVIDFLGGAESPTPLSPTEVQRMLKIQDSPKRVQGGNSLFRKDQVVEITSGPLANFKGIIVSINDSNQTAQVEVEIFGRKTPTQVKLKELRKA